MDWFCYSSNSIINENNKRFILIIKENDKLKSTTLRIR